MTVQSHTNPKVDEWMSNIKTLDAFQRMMKMYEDKEFDSLVEALDMSCGFKMYTLFMDLVNEHVKLLAENVDDLKEPITVIYAYGMQNVLEDDGNTRSSLSIQNSLFDEKSAREKGDFPDDLDALLGTVVRAHTTHSFQDNDATLIGIAVGRFEGDVFRIRLKHLTSAIIGDMYEYPFSKDQYGNIVVDWYGLIHTGPDRIHQSDDSSPFTLIAAGVFHTTEELCNLNIGSTTKRPLQELLEQLKGMDAEMGQAVADADDDSLDDLFYGGETFSPLS